MRGWIRSLYKVRNTIRNKVCPTKDNKISQVAIYPY